MSSGTGFAAVTQAEPTRADIQAAAARMAGFAWRTPVERSAWLSAQMGCDVLLKLECFQRTRSFKVRGAYNAVAQLSDGALRAGIVAASAGNHGLGVAAAASARGAQALVFLPASASAAKRDGITAAGAEIRMIDGTYDDAEAAATEHARVTSATFIHPYDDVHVVAGQGTIGLEILEDVPGAAQVVVPVGGGGLLSGVAIATHGRSVVRGVQSEHTSAMRDAFRAGHPCTPPAGETLADGLAGGVTMSGYQRARSHVSEIAVVPEASIAEAMRAAFRHERIVLEGSAAVAIAALLERMIAPEGPIVVVLSGGNVDARRLAGVLGGG